jgi:hypothetical protein
MEVSDFPFLLKELRDGFVRGKELGPEPSAPVHIKARRINKNYRFTQ